MPTPDASLTLDGVSLPRVGDAIGINQPVLPVQHILHQLLHGRVKERLLSDVWAEDLQT